MTSLHEKFETYLKDRQQRYTGQKDIVAAILKRDHFEIDEFISEEHLKETVWREPLFSER